MQTKGTITRYEVPAFATSRRSAFPLQDNSYNFTIDANHAIVIESTVISGSGKSTHVVWKQDLHFTNLQTYLNNATEIVSLLFCLLFALPNTYSSCFNIPQA